MKPGNKSADCCKTTKHIGLLVTISILAFNLSVCGQDLKNLSPEKQEVPLPGNLRLKFRKNNNPLHLDYPAEVERIYRQAGKKLLWLAPDTVKTHAADAMLLLDCVLQYGLNREDYHSKDLSYNKLSFYTTVYSKTSFAEKVRFDKLLTDAMLTFMNNLHYGKLNPKYRPALIDQGVAGFSAGTELLKALKSRDFDGVVTGVQPQSKAYRNLQYRMHLLEGRINAECYSFPESEIRQMAINMERLRWISRNEHQFIQINIPSLTLTLITRDSTYEFKIIAGAPATPTALRQGALSNFTTLGAHSADRLVFKLAEYPEMNIRGWTDRKLFSQTDRAVSTGYIAVEQPEKLAALLLKYAGANNQTDLLRRALMDGKVQKFSLKKPVPLIITYLTLDINDGIITSYKDIYHQDEDLETALYYQPVPGAKK